MMLQGFWLGAKAVVNFSPLVYFGRLGVPFCIAIYLYGFVVRSQKMLIVNRYPDGGVSLLQGNSLGEAVPIYGDIQRLIRAARARREPVVERQVKA